MFHALEWIGRFLFLSIHKWTIVCNFTPSRTLVTVVNDKVRLNQIFYIFITYYSLRYAVLTYIIQVRRDATRPASRAGGTASDPSLSTGRGKIPGQSIHISTVGGTKAPPTPFRIRMKGDPTLTLGSSFQLRGTTAPPLLPHKFLSRSTTSSIP